MKIADKNIGTCVGIGTHKVAGIACKCHKPAIGADDSTVGVAIAAGSSCGVDRDQCYSAGAKIPLASLANTTNRPLALITAFPEAPLPLSVPALLTLTRLVAATK